MQQESEPAVQSGSTGIEYVDFTAGTSQADAGELPLSVKVKGTYTEGSIWAEFTTAGDANAQYCLVLQNLSAGSSTLAGYLLNRYGEVIYPAARNNSYSDGRIFNAENNGTPSYAVLDSLNPDTTYYIRIAGGSSADYSLAVAMPEQEDLICIAKDTLSGGDPFFMATNPDAAPLLMINQKYEGIYDGKSAWMAFRTEDETKAYYLTLQNHTADAGIFEGYLFDEYGRQIQAVRKNNSYSDGRVFNADNSGTASYSMVDMLKPGTVYYIRIQNNSKAAFSIAVAAEDSEGLISTRKETISSPDHFDTGTNPDTAPLLAINVDYQGQYDTGYSWLAFSTGSDGDKEYYITLTNRSSDCRWLTGYLFDEYGRQIQAVRKNNSYSDGRILFAESDGTTSFSMVDNLKGNTTYYIRIDGNSKADYQIGISDHE